MIEVCELTKRYGSAVAVDGLSFTVRPGRVTGFLGPNGAGKSTTMRVILGLDAPTAGWATVNGRPYQQLSRPLHQAEDDPHRGGLAGAVGAQEAGDPARMHGEAEPVDGHGAAVALGELMNLDHFCAFR